MKVPNKVQMFWKVKTKTICPMCRRLDEDCGHLFFKCKRACDGWRILQTEETRSSLVQWKSGKEVTQKLWAMQPDQQIKISVALEVVDGKEQGKRGRKGAKCCGGMQLQSTVT